MIGILKSAKRLLHSYFEVPTAGNERVGRKETSLEGPIHSRGWIKRRGKKDSLACACDAKACDAKACDAKISQQELRSVRSEL